MNKSISEMIEDLVADGISREAIVDAIADRIVGELVEGCEALAAYGGCNVIDTLEVMAEQAAAEVAR